MLWFYIFIAVILVCLAIGWGLYRLSRVLLQTHALSQLGQPVSHLRDETAIVIGASMAGMATAAVLSAHFRNVVVLERDPQPDKDDPLQNCPGVPQDYHPHAVTVRGLGILSKLFPGFIPAMEALGAQWMRVGKEVHIEAFGGSLAPQNEDFLQRTSVLVGCRPLLATAVRRLLVAQKSNVTVRYRCPVRALLRQGKHGPIKGVTFTDRSTGQQDELLGSFVVDASGSKTQLSRWTAQIGVPPIPTEAVNARIAYSSVIVQGEPKDHALFGRKQGQILAVYTMPLGGILRSTFAIVPRHKGSNNSVFTVLRSGADPSSPPSGVGQSPASMMEWVTADKQSSHTAAALAAFSGWKAVEGEVPVPYHAKGNRICHLEQIESAWPDGLAVVGDAMCFFNPVFGQGMTNALIHTVQLDAQLRQQWALQPGASLQGLTQRYHRECGFLNAVPWLLAAGQDVYVPGATGQFRLLGLPFPAWAIMLLNKFLEQFVLLSHRRESFAMVFWEVFNMTRTPLSLLHPSLLLPTLFKVAFPTQRRA